MTDRQPCEGSFATTPTHARSAGNDAFLKASSPGGNMRHTAIITAALLLAGLTASCSSNDKADAKPEAATSKPPATVTATATQVLSEEQIIEQCTDAVAEAAPGWDNWNLAVVDWKDDPKTPEVCKALDYLAFSGAFVDGLDIAAACDTPAALPGRC